MSRVALARIPALNFYKDALTESRRTPPIPQLICIGKACRLYTPDVVRCTNLGGEGTDVDWKCEADLPEALRFGRVEVSCEGWSGPGDPYVLKGSCSLEYRLNEVPSALRQEGIMPRLPSQFSRWLNDPTAAVFTVLWIAVLVLILYKLVKSCLSGPSHTRRPASGTSGPTSGSGWFPGNFRRDDHDDRGPPPPYSKHSNTGPSQNNSAEGWRPGFWTGAALGGLGTYLFSNRQQANMRTTPYYDWEREWVPRAPQPSPPVAPLYSSGRRSAFHFDDRGEGSSNLGPTRRSTGFGGSNVR